MKETFLAHVSRLAHLLVIFFTRRIEKEKNALQSEGDDLAVSLETLQKQKVCFDDTWMGICRII